MVGQNWRDYQGNANFREQAQYFERRKRLEKEEEKGDSRSARVILNPIPSPTVILNPYLRSNLFEMQTRVSCLHFTLIPIRITTTTTTPSEILAVRIVYLGF